ncbi:MAG: hypothetical protein M0R75_06965 [Dehalococcoidia bacterium]|nr:hypothetical protein [Dehalococcoidia bacterium]
MDDGLVAAWLSALRSGLVHRVRVERVGHLGARRMETLCGISAAIIRLADDEPVSCGACLERDGEPAVHMAEYVIAVARRAVPA